MKSLLVAALLTPWLLFTGFAAERAEPFALPPTGDELNREIVQAQERLETLRRERREISDSADSIELAKQLEHRIAATERVVRNWSLLRQFYHPAAEVPPAARLTRLRAAIAKVRAAGNAEFANGLEQRAKVFAMKLEGGGAPPGTGPASFTAGYAAAVPPVPADWIKPVPSGTDAGTLFTKRILPIFNSPKPSSCNECHLSGVDLKDYLLPDQAQTFAALVADKLVDVTNPDASKILEFIQRRPERPSLVKDRIRQEEFEAFRAWLHMAVKDPVLLAAKRSGTAAGPGLPVEVIRHARTDRVLASFVENVWSEIQRCTHCHDPRHNAKQVERHGVSLTWITPDDPLATLAYLRRGGLIDVDHPEKSLILTKPTMEVEHKGGIKMIKGDLGYKQFLTFIQDYAATVRGQYTSAGQLPKPAALVPTVTQLTLRVTDIPEQYRSKPLQVMIHGHIDGGWSRTPVAAGLWAVWPRKLMWQSRLTLLAPRGSAGAGRKDLPPGRYLAKIYIDESGRLAKDPLAELGPDEFKGQVEFRAAWKPAPQNAEIIRFPVGARAQATGPAR